MSVFHAEQTFATTHRSHKGLALPTAQIGANPNDGGIATEQRFDAAARGLVDAHADTGEGSRHIAPRRLCLPVHH